jgi:hypothetical protein
MLADSDLVPTCMAGYKMIVTRDPAANTANPTTLELEYYAFVVGHAFEINVGCSDLRLAAS